jgi:hypothetical protein
MRALTLARLMQHGHSRIGQRAALTLAKVTRGTTYVAQEEVVVDGDGLEVGL